MLSFHFVGSDCGRAGWALEKDSPSRENYLRIPPLDEMKYFDFLTLFLDIVLKF